MRLAILSLALTGLALFPPTPVAAHTPAADAWVTLPEKIPPFRNTPLIASDPARNLYFHGAEGVYLLEAGSLRPLPLPVLPGLQPTHFLPLNPQEYWVGMAGSGEDGKDYRFLFHHGEGGWTRYDSSTTPCSQGIPLGLDAAGHPILELRTYGTFAATSQGVFRLVGGRCEAVPLGLEKNRGKLATRYFRDSRGREYFALNHIGDVPRCAGFVRLGDTLERFETMELERDPLGVTDPRVPLCVHDFEESGDTVFLASHPGLGILVDTAITHVRSFRGVAAWNLSEVLRDSRGVLWVGTEGYDFSPAPLGLVRIQGADTTLMHKHNSGFPSLYPKRLWEDKAGNIWVWMAEGGGYAVHLREGSPYPLGLAPRARRLLPGQSGNTLRAWDLLGRKAPPPGRSAGRPRVPVFPGGFSAP